MAGKKDSSDIQEKRFKYDSRNVVFKRESDQLVNADLCNGIIRKQGYKQHGINMMTLRRYIREAQRKEEKRREESLKKFGRNILIQREVKTTE